MSDDITRYRPVFHPDPDKVTDDMRAAQSAVKRREIADKLSDQLGNLGVNNMIAMQSEHTVMVDVRTLHALIALSEVALGHLPCGTCGGDREVTLQIGPDITYNTACVLCRTDGD